MVINYIFPIGVWHYEHDHRGLGGENYDRYLIRIIDYLNDISKLN
jgi:hypothetical protein